MANTLTLKRLFAGLTPPPEYVGCGPETTIAALQVDSRQVTPGAAFVAVQGETHDGHTFVDQARERGASVLILQRGRCPAPAGPHVWLADTSEAQPELAANAYGRPGEQLRLAGLTGTNGKTTTAHLVGAVFRQAGLGHVRLGTTGNWLVDHEAPAALTTPFPLELQSMLADAVARGGTHAVMEVSSHALAQGRAQPLRFAAVGMTSFSQDHLDFHETMEAYLAAKCLLAKAHLRADGVAVAAVDEQPAALRFLEAAVPGARQWRASRGGVPDAEILARDVVATPEGVRARVQTPMGEIRLRSPLFGGFNLDNLLVAIGLALGLGLTKDAIEKGLAEARGAPGRLEPVVVDGVPGPRVVVDYAHTPDAVERAIAAVRPVCQGRLFVLLGCGGDRDPKKRPIMGAVAARGADRLWATSDNPRTEDPEAIIDMMLEGVSADARERVVRQSNRGEAIAEAIAEAKDDDLVLIAGKGHEDYQILGEKTIHFDDREHAKAALERRRLG